MGLRGWRLPGAAGRALGDRAFAPVVVGMVVFLVQMSAASITAHAHCGSAEARGVVVRPAAAREIWVELNFGSAISRDDGASWALQCEEVYQPPGAVAVPANIASLTPAGKIVVAHRDGLFVSGDQGCSYGRGGGVPRDVSVLGFALDASDPEQRLLAVAADTLYGSNDGGRTLTPVKSFPEEDLGGVAMAPDDAAVLFLVASRFDATGVLEYRIHHSVDGGATFRSFTSPLGISALRIARVPPRARRMAYVVVDDGGEDVLYRMEIPDGGAAVFTMLWKTAGSEIGGSDKAISLALGAAEGELWLGIRGSDIDGAGGQLLRSRDTGNTWTPLPGRHPHFRCLERMDDGTLWGCGNNLDAVGDTFVVGVSRDEGKTWTGKFAFGDLCRSIPCATSFCDKVLDDACVPGICAANASEPGTREPAGPEAVDAGNPGPGAEPTAPDDGSGCCRVVPASSDLLPLLLAAAAAAAASLAGRRRRV